MDELDGSVLRHPAGSHTDKPCPAHGWRLDGDDCGNCAVELFRRRRRWEAHVYQAIRLARSGMFEVVK